MDFYEELDESTKDMDPKTKAEVQKASERMMKYLDAGNQAAADREAAKLCKLLEVKPITLPGPIMKAINAYKKRKADKKAGRKSSFLAALKKRSAAKNESAYEWLQEAATFDVDAMLECTEDMDDEEFDSFIEAVVNDELDEGLFSNLKNKMAASKQQRQFNKAQRQTKATQKKVNNAYKNVDDVTANLLKRNGSAVMKLQNNSYYDADMDLDEAVCDLDESEFIDLLESVDTDDDLDEATKKAVKDKMKKARAKNDPKKKKARKRKLLDILKGKKCAKNESADMLLTEASDAIVDAVIDECDDLDDDEFDSFCEAIDYDDELSSMFEAAIVENELVFASTMNEAAGMSLYEAAFQEEMFSLYESVVLNEKSHYAGHPWDGSSGGFKQGTQRNKYASGTSREKAYGNFVRDKAVRDDFSHLNKISSGGYGSNRKGLAGTTKKTGSLSGRAREAMGKVGSRAKTAARAAGANARYAGRDAKAGAQLAGEEIRRRGRDVKAGVQLAGGELKRHGRDAKAAAQLGAEAARNHAKSAARKIKNGVFAAGVKGRYAAKDAALAAKGAGRLAAAGARIGAEKARAGANRAANKVKAGMAGIAASKEINRRANIDHKINKLQKARNESAGDTDWTAQDYYNNLLESCEFFLPDIGSLYEAAENLSDDDYAALTEAIAGDEDINFMVENAFDWMEYLYENGELDEYASEYGYGTGYSSVPAGSGYAHLRAIAEGAVNPFDGSYDDLDEDSKTVKQSSRESNKTIQVKKGARKIKLLDALKRSASKAVAHGVRNESYGYDDDDDSLIEAIVDDYDIDESVENTMDMDDSEFNSFCEAVAGDNDDDIDEASQRKVWQRETSKRFKEGGGIIQPDERTAREEYARNAHSARLEKRIAKSSPAHANVLRHRDEQSATRHGYRVAWQNKKLGVTYDGTPLKRKPKNESTTAEEYLKALAEGTTVEDEELDEGFFEKRQEERERKQVEDRRRREKEIIDRRAKKERDYAEARWKREDEAKKKAKNESTTAEEYLRALAEGTEGDLDDWDPEEAQKQAHQMGTAKPTGDFKGWKDDSCPYTGEPEPDDNFPSGGNFKTPAPDFAETMTATDTMYLRALSETSNNDDVLEILGKSTVDSTVLVIKASWVFGKQLGSAGLSKDPDEKLERYKKCLRDAKALRKAANKIPPDGLADHIWRLIAHPWWSSAYSYGSATVKGDVLNITKNDTIAKFDMVIKYIENQIRKLKEEGESE